MSVTIRTSSVYVQQVGQAKSQLYNGTNCHNICDLLLVRATSAFYAGSSRLKPLPLNCDNTKQAALTDCNKHCKTRPIKLKKIILWLYACKLHFIIRKKGFAHSDKELMSFINRDALLYRHIHDLFWQCRYQNTEGLWPLMDHMTGCDTLLSYWTPDS